MKSRKLGTALLTVLLSAPVATFAHDIAIERFGAGSSMSRIYKCEDCDAAVFHMQRAATESTGELRRRAMRRCRQAGMPARRLAELPSSSGNQRRASYILVCSDR